MPSFKRHEDEVTVRYTGRYDSVVLPSLDPYRVVMRGDVIEVPASVAENLLLQGDEWEAVTTRSET